MKNTFTFLLTLLGAVSFAQLPVSTELERRHVIVEKFTGLRCTYCPLATSQLAPLKKDNVYVINVHASNWADPVNSGGPDMRTAEGEIIDGIAQKQGYPAMGFNRGKGKWSTLGAGQDNSHLKAEIDKIQGDTSYVNVAFQGTVNSVSREMTVDVEVYYTDSAPSDKQYLSVVLLQDHIVASQAGANLFDPENILDNGLYRHTGVLRKYVNPGGTDGDAIDFVLGQVIKRQYKMALPDSIGNVPLSLAHLRVVGFIMEESTVESPIVTGNSGSVALVDDSGNSLQSIDLSAEGQLPDFTSHCVEEFTPKCKITNAVGSCDEGFEVGYVYDGNTVSEQVTSETLNSGDTYEHTFAKLNISPGLHALRYFVNSTGTKSYDKDLGGNISKVKSFTTKSQSVDITAPYGEDFESYQPRQPVRGFHDIAY